MSVFALIITAAVLGSLIVSIGVTKSPFVRHSIQLGLEFWKRFVPVVAGVAFMGILIGNVTKTRLISHVLPLPQNFIVEETIFLSILCCLLFTRMRNIIGILAIAYLSLRLAMVLPKDGVVTHSISYAVLLLLMLVMTLFLSYSEKRAMMPSVSANMHRVLFMSIAFVGLASTTWSLFHLHQFLTWMEIFDLPFVSEKLLIVVLPILFVGWLTVLFDVTARVLILPIILPTNFAIAFAITTNILSLLIFTIIAIFYALFSATRTTRTTVVYRA